MAEGLEEFASDVIKQHGGIPAKYTCHRGTLDRAPAEYKPEMVRETRRLLHVSQAVFAQLLGVSTSTVRAWEQGIRIPRDAACRLMDEIRDNPRYWQNRLQCLAAKKSKRR